MPDRLRGGHWLVSGVALALAPKCLLCLAAYAGAGAALGLGGPELCGAPAASGGSWSGLLPAVGVAAGLTGFFVQRRRGAR